MKKSLLSFIFLLTLLLNACAPTLQSYETTESTAISNPYPQSVETYLQQAQTSDLSEKQDALLNAGGRLLYEQQPERAAQILRQIEIEPLNQNQHTHLLFLHGQLALEQGKPAAVLPYLAKIENPDDLTIEEQQRYHQLLARAYALNGEIINSVNQRIKLNHLLSNEKAQLNNNKMIWQTLKEAPLSSLHTESLEEKQEELLGWIQIADVNQRYNNQPQQLISHIEKWKQQFPNHPANTILQGSTEDSIQIGNPQHIALLLPLTGNLARSGNAVRKGVEASQQEHPNTTLHFYDTNKTNDISRLYHQAISDGAEVVIGPLTKPDVNKLSETSIPIPTIALNYTNASSTPNNFFEFGISPKDEALAVALKATQDGHHRAIIIAPKNEWGTEVTQVFTQRWQGLGGKISGQLNYAPHENFNEAIRGFFGIDESQQREAKLQRVLGRKIQFVPRSRDDADMIFLLADPITARQILPLLKYYYVGHLPVYATSLIYSGINQEKQDRDLNGVIFCDVPWVLGNSPTATSNRLYALGKDAYQLIFQLPRLTQYPQLQLFGSTGKLTLQAKHTIKRELAWAQFKDGIPQLL